MVSGGIENSSQIPSEHLPEGIGYPVEQLAEGTE
jgi:hypothetical protein